MAIHCLRLPSTTSSCWCSSFADYQPSSSSPSPVCFLTRGGEDGVRSLSSSSSSSSSSFIIVSRSCSTSSKRRTASLSVRAGIRAVETYDASFQLQPEADKTLRESLSSPTFCAQVADQSMKGPDVKYEFTGELFQPVPWSPTTKFGMPMEFEKYIKDKENFTVINVPPNFMFKAKIFKPSRLCAVFKRV